MTGLTPSDDAQWGTEKWAEIQAINDNSVQHEPVEARLWVSNPEPRTAESTFIDTLNFEMQYFDGRGKLHQVNIYLHKDDAERLGILLQYSATHKKEASGND